MAASAARGGAAGRRCGAKEFVEDIGKSKSGGVRPVESAEAARAEPGTTQVVLLAFLRVTQHVIGGTDFFEFFLVFGTSHVRVQFARQLAIGVLNFVLRSVTAHTEGFIVVAQGFSFLFSHLSGRVSRSFPRVALDLLV